MTGLLSLVSGAFTIGSGLLVAAFGTPKEGAVPSGLILVMMGVWLLST